MTTFYSDVMTLLTGFDGADVAGRPSAKVHGGSLTVLKGEIDLSANTVASGDDVEMIRMRKGMIPLYGILVPSAAMGATATIAIGITGDTGKYRAAAVKNNTTPEVFGLGDAVGTELTADETVLATIAAANLPTSGILRIIMVASQTGG